MTVPSATVIVLAPDDASLVAQTAASVRAQRGAAAEILAVVPSGASSTELSLIHI